MWCKSGGGQKCGGTMFPKISFSFLKKKYKSEKKVEHSTHFFLAIKIDKSKTMERTPLLPAKTTLVDTPLTYKELMFNLSAKKRGRENKEKREVTKARKTNKLCGIDSMRNLGEEDLDWIPLYSA